MDPDDTTYLNGLELAFLYPGAYSGWLHTNKFSSFFNRKHLDSHDMRKYNFKVVNIGFDRKREER